MRRTLLYLIKKEFIQLIRDRRMLVILLVLPLMQLVAYGYIFSTDVKHLQTAVRDLDKSGASRSLISSFTNTGYFEVTEHVSSEKEISNLIDRGSVQVGLDIPKGFARRLSEGKKAPVQILIDGSDSNVASSALSYSQRIIASKAPEVKGLSQVETRIRVLFNPDLKSVNYMIPGLIGILLLMITTILTAAALVKEREQGTLEQLVVMPIKRYELVLGKIIPFILVGLLNVSLAVVLGILWFGVPLRGSVMLLFALSIIFVFTTLGLGLFTSTVSKTQQQAMWTAYFIMLPSMLLSGLIFPIENMPKVIQYVTYLIPLRYYLVIVRGIFLKGSGMAELWSQVAILAFYAVAIFGLSVVWFQKKLT